MTCKSFLALQLLHDNYVSVGQEASLDSAIILLYMIYEAPTFLFFPPAPLRSTPLSLTLTLTLSSRIERQKSLLSRQDRFDNGIEKPVELD